jgi:hypothetical protein
VTLNGYMLAAALAIFVGTSANAAPTYLLCTGTHKVEDLDKNPISIRDEKYTFRLDEAQKSVEYYTYGGGLESICTYGEGPCNVEFNPKMIIATSVTTGSNLPTGFKLLIERDTGKSALIYFDRSELDLFSGTCDRTSEPAFDQSTNKF